jgi:hypothetical protein
VLVCHFLVECQRNGSEPICCSIHSASGAPRVL